MDLRGGERRESDVIGAGDLGRLGEGGVEGGFFGCWLCGLGIC